MPELRQAKSLNYYRSIVFNEYRIAPGFISREYYFKRCRADYVAEQCLDGTFLSCRDMLWFMANGEPSLILWCAIPVGAALSTIIHHFLSKRKFPSYTFPFIVVTWMFMVIASHFPNVFQQQTGTTSAAANDYLTLFTYSFGQVI